MDQNLLCTWSLHPLELQPTANPLQVFMALLTIGPWALVFLYDILLYLWRAVYYEIPIVGGRARGRARPRAPTLTERPSGDPRTLGLTKISSRGDEDNTAMATGEDDKPDGPLRRRHAEASPHE
jgi:hypothetical protein